MSPRSVDRRANTRNTRRADALLGYLIPVFFVLVAGYQQVKTGHIDKYVIGVLLIFGLGALGWRLDVLFEKYVEMKMASSRSSTGDTEDEHPESR